MRIVTVVTFLCVVLVSVVVQQSMKAMEGAVITLQFHADAKILPLIRQLIEVSEGSKPSPRHFLDFSAAEVQRKEDKTDVLPALKPKEFGEALTSLDAAAIEIALVNQSIQSMVERLSSGEDEIEFSELIEKVRALLREEKERKSKKNTLFGAVLAKILPEVLVEAIFKLCGNDGYVKMIIACELGDSGQMLDWIQNYLKTAEGIKELEVEVEGAIPLISAATRGTVSIAQLLIDAGATVNMSNICGETPLIAAAVSDRPEMIQLLLSNKAFIDWRNDAGYTALHSAIRYDRRNSITLLIELGADMNLRNEIGYSPLTTAISCNNADLVRLLLEKGAFYNRDGMNSEMKYAINELDTLYTWSNRDQVREEKAKDIIIQLVFDKRTVINAGLIESLQKVGMSEVVQSKEAMEIERCAIEI
jgi:hypothetical protein